MRAFTTTENNNSPFIELNPDERKFTISGKSFPENAEKFYRPVFEWFDEFTQSVNLPEPIVFDFDLEYVNSASIFSLLEIIQRLGQLNARGFNFKVQWYYDDEDEDIKKIGEDFGRLTPVQIDMICVEED